MAVGTKLTRRELYDLVWSTPMRTLAQQFGISDVGLKKSCDRHRVPTPPRGYWAQIEAGKKTKKAVFVEVDDARLNQIEVGTHALQLPEPVRHVIEVQRAERKQHAERRRAPKTIVEHEPIRDPHPKIKATARELRATKERSEIARAKAEGMCGVEIGQASIERAIFILDQMARAFEERGLPLVPIGNGMRVEVGPDSAILRLIERVRKVDHIPTAEEIEAEARRQKRLSRSWNDESTWFLGGYDRSYPEKDIIRTGQLSVQIEGYTEGVRRTWADGKLQTVEDLIPSIVDGTEILLAARKAAREAREEHARRWTELRRRRQLAQQRGEREKARLDFFERLGAVRQEATLLRDQLSQIRGSIGGASVSIDRMIDWGERRLASLEAQLDPLRIEETATNAKLFPSEEDDELFDPLGDPPDGHFW
ncbi:hypothetical protein [Enterovirga rhinocerotis]|nr:hypothetical protein [Enterovirga rhinocerotis]